MPGGKSVWLFRLAWSAAAIVAVVNQDLVAAVLIVGIAVLYVGESR